MMTHDRATLKARLDRVYARRVSDELYHVSSVRSRLARKAPYEVRLVGGWWQCSCPAYGECKHIARVKNRDAAEQARRREAYLARQHAASAAYVSIFGTDGDA